MHHPRSDRPVLVGIKSLNNVQQLVRTAGDLAYLGAGTVRLVTVAVKRSDSPFRVFSDETIVHEFDDSSHELLDRATTPEDVAVERDVLVARSATKGLLAAVEETDPAALVVGWRAQERRTDAVFGTTVDALVERAPCDLYVERVGHEANGVDIATVVVTLLFAAVSFQYIRLRTQASIDMGVKTFLVVLGSLVAFSSGGSQVGLATGPLENLYRAELGLPAIGLLALGATGILSGAWMGAPRLLQATSREYAQLGIRRSIAALVPGFVIAQLAITLGIPISFNNIIISGVIGGGLAGGSAGVSRRKIGITLGFWFFTLGMSIVIGFGLYRLFATMLGA